MKIISYFFAITFIIIFMNCMGDQSDMTKNADFKYFMEQFADVKIGRYQIPGFEKLAAKQKEMLYYLYQAALSGRDIIWDQNYKHNLKIRRTLEAIVNSYEGDRGSKEFEKFMVYTKSVWFSNGIHHFYSTDKYIPEFSQEYFQELIKNSAGGDFPLRDGESIDDLISFLTPIIFDPEIDYKRISTNPEGDLIKESANNFYAGVTQAEVLNYYQKVKKENDPTPISYGLNSQLIKENGKLAEKFWKVGGMYSEAIEKIVYWLGKAQELSETETQKEALELLIRFYQTGDLRLFDEYSIIWTQETQSSTDVVNGFIETYGDALEMKGSYESVVSFRDEEATRRAKAISDNAQWFEDNSPIADEHKKKNVRGVTAKVITVVALGGEASPYPPIGINLPNSRWIRKQYGSKSVTLGNISAAYDKVSEGSGILEEFTYAEEDLKRNKQYGELADNLHTDMHEILGHASGQINPGVGTPRETLKNYAAVIEEARADLVAYYYAIDPKLTEIGVMPKVEVGKVTYERAMRNGLITQLTRIKLEDDIEQAHMRNRQLIAKWALELGKSEKIVETKVKDGKTYIVVNDYQKLRLILGKMLREIQRITSVGDYNAAKALVEAYGVKIDYDLHKEVLERFKKLGIAPYTGFINPILRPVKEGDQIIDVVVEYPTDFTEQMLYYAEKYSFLPTTQ